jgi:hypothetical protein
LVPVGCCRESANKEILPPHDMSNENITKGHGREGRMR